MSDHEVQIIAYQTCKQFEMMRLAVSPANRDWMNQTNSGFANRCLPMRIANQAGWVILNDRRLRAKWLGHTAPGAVVIECEGGPPYAAISHFGEGVLSFTIPFLFRTSPGLSLLIRGPANMPKDAIAPLEGLVETDWSVAAASVNWKFTRADTWVEFAREEPICMIVPQYLDLLEAAQPRILDITKDPETHQKYKVWNKSIRDFNERLSRQEPEAVSLGWQRFYFKGTAPHASVCPMPESSAHRTQLNLRSFVETD